MGAVQRECAPYDLEAHPFHTAHAAQRAGLLSPHTSGWSDAQLQRRVAIIAANLDAVARGQLPTNVVYRGEAKT